MGCVVHGHYCRLLFCSFGFVLRVLEQKGREASPERYWALGDQWTTDGRVWCPHLSWVSVCWTSQQFIGSNPCKKHDEESGIQIGVDSCCCCPTGHLQRQQEGPHCHGSVRPLPLCQNGNGTKWVVFWHSRCPERSGRLSYLWRTCQLRLQFGPFEHWDNTTKSCDKAPEIHCRSDITRVCSGTEGICVRDASAVRVRVRCRTKCCRIRKTKTFVWISADVRTEGRIHVPTESIQLTFLQFLHFTLLKTSSVGAILSSRLWLLLPLLKWLPQETKGKRPIFDGSGDFDPCIFWVFKTKFCIHLSNGTPIASAKDGDMRKALRFPQKMGSLIAVDSGSGCSTRFQTQRVDRCEPTAAAPRRNLHSLFYRCTKSHADILKIHR